MTHKLQTDGVGDTYGYIMAGPYTVGFGDLSHGYVIDTFTGVSLPADPINDLTDNFYHEMLASFGTSTPMSGYDRYAVMNALTSVTSFYQEGDTDGSPTATRLPASIAPFARLSYDVGPGVDFTITLDRSDGSVTYDSSAHTLAPFGSNIDVLGTDLRSDVNLMADVQGAHTLRIAVTADGPADGYWRLYAIGLRYPVVPKTQPPLRQWPRNDGLRSTRRQGAPGPTSQQGSIRRGPRGTYI